jgi:hypothetical protein
VYKNFAGDFTGKIYIGLIIKINVFYFPDEKILKYNY